MHNGIIENFAALRAELEAAGHELRSETDTEIAAHLLEVEVAAGRRPDRRDAARSAAGCTARSPWSPSTARTTTRVVAARRNSPLVVGIGEGENFLASDVAAFIEHTRDALELGQDQVVTITREGVEVTDFDGNAAEAPPYHVDWDLSAAEKGGYDWFMRKEIHEQPQAIADSMLGRHDASGALQLDEVRLSEAELRDVDKIIIIGCGTAFYAGLVAKYAIEHWTRIPCEVELAHEFRYRDPILTRDTLVVAISQSGETADTLMAIRHAREQRAKVLAICNTNGSTIPRESDAVIYTHAGPEIGVASTKGFMTQLVACYLLGLYLAQVRGTKLRRRDRRDRPRARADAGPRAVRCSTRPTRCTGSPQDLVDAKSVLFLGRHAGYPVALEGALKLKELAYIHAEGFAAGELKHGPIALVEDRLPVFCVVPPQGRDFLHDKMVSDIQEVRARGARTIVLAEEGDAEVAPYADVLLDAAEGADAAAADGRGRPAAAVRLRAGHAAGPRRRPAAQPGQVRHGRVGRCSVPVIGVGIDVVDIARFGETLERTPALRERLFTEQERDRPLASLAARFAAKEALAKALGAPVGMHWLDAEVVADASGDPTLRDARLGARPGPRSSGWCSVHVSLSHDAGIASAVVVLES